MKQNRLKSTANYGLTLLFMILLFCNCSSPKKTPPHTTEGEFASAQYRMEIPKPIGYTNDFAHIFSPGEIDTLNSIIQQHEKETSNQIAIVTLDSVPVPEKDFDTFTLELSGAWGVGQKEKNNGIVICICTRLRKIRIENGLGIQQKLSDEETQNIIDTIIIPEFKTNSYYEGIRKGLIAVIEKLKK